MYAPVWIGKSMRKVLIDMGLLSVVLMVNMDIDDYLFKLYMWIYCIRCFCIWCLDFLFYWMIINPIIMIF
jgi:hypothetical protein